MGTLSEQNDWSDIVYSSVIHYPATILRQLSRQKRQGGKDTSIKYLLDLVYAIPHIIMWLGLRSRAKQ